MTSILCMLALWQPATTPPAAPKDVRGVAITFSTTTDAWFSVTLKKEGEDWEDVLPQPTADAECDCFFAALPRSGLNFDVIFSMGSRPQIQIPGADELLIADGPGILDVASLNNFGLHQIF
jgi:hypothetical protein